MRDRPQAQAPVVSRCAEGKLQVEALTAVQAFARIPIDEQHAHLAPRTPADVMDIVSRQPVFRNGHAACEPASPGNAGCEPSHTARGRFANPADQIDRGLRSRAVLHRQHASALLARVPAGGHHRHFDQHVAGRCVNAHGFDEPVGNVPPRAEIDQADAGLRARQQ